MGVLTPEEMAELPKELTLEKKVKAALDLIVPVIRAAQKHR